MFMVTKNFSNLSRWERFFYEKWWPDYMFVNDYPLIGVIWNVFLSLIPFFLFFYLAKLWRKNSFQKNSQKVLGFFVFAVWLLFLPNAAYIITDVRHLSDYCSSINYFRVCPESAWMIMFFFVYAAFGWVTFVFALSLMNKLLSEIFSTRIAQAMVAFILPLSALGVLLGLLNRWNSWEILSQPRNIFESLSYYFFDWEYFKNWLFFSLGLFLLYYLGQFLFHDLIIKIYQRLTK
jgi:uncharacterized membrane protein